MPLFIEDLDDAVFAGHPLGQDRLVAAESPFEIDGDFDLSGGPDRQDYQLVHALEALDEPFEVVQGPGIFVGLPDHFETGQPPHLLKDLQRFEGRTDLRRMVAVVVDDDAVLVVLDDVEALFDPPIVPQTLPELLRIFAQLHRREDRQRGIQRDVRPEAENFERPEIFQLETGVGFPVDQDKFDLSQIFRRVKTDRIDIEQSQKGVFPVEHPDLRQIQKLAIGGVEALLVVLVILHMFGLDVGDDRQIGVGVEKALVALVRFENHPVVGGAADVGTELFADGADEGVGLGQQRRQHRRGGALPVGPADGVNFLVSQNELERLFAAEQFDPQLFRPFVLDVAGAHRRRIDHPIHPLHRIGMMGNRDLRPVVERQVVGDFALAHIAAADRVSLPRQKFRQSRKPDTAYADEMDFHSASGKLPKAASLVYWALDIWCRDEVPPPNKSPCKAKLSEWHVIPNSKPFSILHSPSSILNRSCCSLPSSPAALSPL